MTEIYRKFGRVVRYENGTFVSVSEAGEAFEEDGVFQARPAVEVPAQTGVSVPDPARADLDAFVNVAQTLLSVLVPLPPAEPETLRPLRTPRRIPKQR